MKPYEDIQQILSKHKERLLSNYPIRSLAIFGSYSRGEQKSNSDLDILVEFSGQVGIRFVDLAEELEELLGVKVDLVSKNGVKDNYLKHIQEELIYV